MSSSLGHGPPLFVKVNVFTLKKCSPVVSCQGLQRATEEWEKEGEGQKNISLNTKCGYYSCGVLKYTPCRHVMCSLVGAQLESTPFSACWRKWCLVEAEISWGVLRWHWHTGVKCFTADTCVCTYADANTQCKCVSAFQFVGTCIHLLGPPS